MGYKNLSPLITPYYVFSEPLSKENISVSLAGDSSTVITPEIKGDTLYLRHTAPLAAEKSYSVSIVGYTKKGERLTVDLSGDAAFTTNRGLYAVTSKRLGGKQPLQGDILGKRHALGQVLRLARHGPMEQGCKGQEVHLRRQRVPQCRRLDQGRHAVRQDVRDIRRLPCGGRHRGHEHHRPREERALLAGADGAHRAFQGTRVQFVRGIQFFRGFEFVGRVQFIG